MKLKQGDYVQIKEVAPGVEIPHVYFKLGVLQVQKNEPENPEAPEGDRKWHVRQMRNEHGKKMSHLIEERYFVKVV